MDLLSAAMRAVGARTKRGAILEGLRRILAPSVVERARRMKGKISLDIDLEKHSRERHADAR